MEQQPNSCWIIGVLDSGLDSLTPAARGVMEEADLVLGDPRFLQLFTPLFGPRTECRSFAGHLKELPDWITTACRQGRRVVVLATGDPLLSGVAGHLRHKLAAGYCRILPTLSTPQLAFARLGLPWTGARIVSVHARDGGEWHAAPGMAHPLYSLYQALPGADLLAVLTSPANSPARIARMVMHLGWEEQFQMAVAECLATPQERIHPELRPAQVANSLFADPNVVIVQRNQEVSSAPLPVLGLADGCFLPEGSAASLITKREVRVIALANLVLHSTRIVWDLGAGSGSVGLEAARLLPQGWVCAVEKDPGRCRQIEQVRARLCINNYQLLNSLAPQGLEAWPDPDSVFIGGSDGGLPELIRLAVRRLRPHGRLVITLVTLENLSRTLDTLREIGWNWRLNQIQISHSQPILSMHRLVPASPVWMVTAGQSATELP
ncbi:MAG: precorrin-6y C5,15-methyltransferase (decarboxylating) subunit CbiE [Magnetococcus sp. MYC-9]